MIVKLLIQFCYTVNQLLFKDLEKILGGGGVFPSPP
jgi:hypothetical protein